MGRLLLLWFCLLVCMAFPAHAWTQDTLVLRGDTIRVGELEWDIEKDWRSRKDLLSANKDLYGEHVQILLKYHRNKYVAQIQFGYVSDDSGFVQHGPTRLYYDSGQLQGKRYYYHGSLTGPAADYHKNGAKRVECFFRDGELDGEYKTYFENGVLEHKATYEGGIPVGSQHAWYSNGQRKWVEYYDQGIRTGPDTSFYENGAVESISHFEDGKLHGTWRCYHRNGALWSERTYAQGRLLEINALKSKEGRPLEPGPFHKGNGWLTIYDDDGLVLEKELYKNGLVKKVKVVKR